MPRKFNYTGYYLGELLFIVFYIPAIGLYAHCSKRGCFNQASPFPEGYEEFFNFKKGA